MSATSAANGPDRSANKPMRMVSSVTPKSVSTSTASPPPPASPPASSSSSPPQPAATRAAARSSAMSLRVALITLPLGSLPLCWSLARGGSVAERPPLPVVADLDPDAVQPERLEDEERHHEQPVEDLVELEDRDARSADRGERDQPEVVAPDHDHVGELGEWSGAGRRLLEQSGALLDQPGRGHHED